ncbi:MAG: ankyrin repeat domain-containing protein [Bryobacteraceae bacterium]
MLLPPLFEACAKGDAKTVRKMLKDGADPNAHELDNTTALHWAAAHRHIEIVRILLDAGADVHGEGDVHELGVIGWATYYRPPGRLIGDQPEVAAYLIKRGARHHIFSAMSLGDIKLLRAVLKKDSNAIHRRMVPWEDSMSPLHFALQIERHDMLKLLIDSGADLEAKDKSSLTPLERALLRGDKKAAMLLTAAGAKKPRKLRPATRKALTQLAANVTSVNPMIYVPNVADALKWYVSIGFTETARYEENGLVNFGIVTFGKAEILVNMHGMRCHQTASLWFNCTQIDALYKRFKTCPIEIAEPINDTFYHARQFAIRDPNGYLLYFIEPIVESRATGS